MNLIRGSVNFVGGALFRSGSELRRTTRQVQIKEVWNRAIGYKGKVAVTISYRRAQALAVENYNREIQQATSQVLKRT